MISVVISRIFLESFRIKTFCPQNTRISSNRYQFSRYFGTSKFSHLIPKLFRYGPSEWPPQHRYPILRCIWRSSKFRLFPGRC